MNDNLIKFSENIAVKTYKIFSAKYSEEENIFYIKGYSTIKQVLTGLVDNYCLSLIGKHLSGIKMFLKIKDGFIHSFVIQGVPGYGKNIDEVLIYNNNHKQVFLYLLYLASTIEGIKRGEASDGIGITKAGVSMDLAEDIAKLEKDIADC